MDFAANLKSSSVRDQSAAALFMRAEGANGAEHLPALLEACQAIDPNDDSLDRFQESLLGFGAMTMGAIIGAIGFDEGSSLHLAILHWIAQSTSSSNLNVAIHSVYGLGNSQSRHPIAVDRLSELASSQRRRSEYEHVTLRAIALRNLRRLDAQTAARLVDYPAFDEYVHAVEHWLENEAPESAEALSELQAEREWLARTKDRRTRP